MKLSLCPRKLMNINVLFVNLISYEGDTFVNKN